MQRRKFITLLGAAATWPLTARAQTSNRIRRIGVLFGLGENDPEGKRQSDALITSLPRLGWKQGENIHIDIRWGGSDAARINESAKALVELNPEVIAVSTTLATAAVIATGTRIPVVFSAVSDAIGPGFVRNFARPEGNVTGFINVEGSVGGKWVELLKEIAPPLVQMVILYNAKTAGAQFAHYRGPIEAAGGSLAVKTQSIHWEDTGDLEKAITSFAQKPNTGLIVVPTPHTVAQRELILALAGRYQIPVMYPASFWVREGGLISYGVDLADLHRRAAGYIDRILKGTKIGELPVQLPTKFELAINNKTAKALGLDVPSQLQQRADEVID